MGIRQGTIGRFQAEARAEQASDGSGSWAGYAFLQRQVGNARIDVRVNVTGRVFLDPGAAADAAWDLAEALNAQGEL